ncbi:MAG TPA: DinB family protein, partial [Microthrixaceae bacterium]|nr:DinB family protein [Microthrixaceae bacterium]
WDQDATAAAERYDEQDPEEVIVALERAASAIAARFATIDGATWQRVGRRSDGASFTIDTFARYLVHDPIHHRGDVERPA